MINKGLIRSITFLGVILLTACSLPEVTPPVETASPAETSFVPSIAGNPSPTAAPIPEPVQINTNNAASLVIVNRSAVSNIQQLKWANDGLSLLVSNQNSDTEGTQMFGVTVLGVPALTPTDIYSTRTERVSDLASDGKKAAMVSLDLSTLSLVDLSSENTTFITISPDYPIGNVTFSPDSAMIAVSKMEAWEVVLYSATDGTEIRTLTGFETAAPIYQAGFKEGPQWMTWLARATLQLQEIETGQLGPELNHSDFVMTYTLTQDGSIVASAASGMLNDVIVPTITLWDAASGTELQTLQLTEMAQCLAFSPETSLLAVGVGNVVQIWNISNGTLVVSLEGHVGMINNVAFSPDGKYLATAGFDNQLYLWQVSE